MMRIAIVTSEFARSNDSPTGGIGIYYKEYCKALVEEGIDVTVFTAGKAKESYEHEGVKVEVLPLLTQQLGIVFLTIEKIVHKISCSYWLLPFFLLDSARIVSRLQSKHKEHPFHIVECPEYLGDLCVYPKELPPLVSKIHGSYHMLRKYAGYRTNKAFFWKEEQQIRNSTYVIANSRFSSSELKESFDRDVDTIISNGVCAPHVDAEVEQMSHSLVYFGSLNANKGLETVVHTFLSLWKSDETWTLDMIGRGKHYFEENILPQLPEQALGNVLYHGPRDKQELLQMLPKFRFAVLPSKVESFGLVYLEAVLLGLVPVVQEQSTTNELLSHRETALICASQSDFSKEILWAVEHSFHVKEHLVQALRNQYSWKAIAQQNIKTYEQWTR